MFTVLKADTPQPSSHFDKIFDHYQSCTVFSFIIATPTNFITKHLEKQNVGFYVI